MKYANNNKRIIYNINEQLTLKTIKCVTGLVWKVYDITWHITHIDHFCQDFVIITGSGGFRWLMGSTEN